MSQSPGKHVGARLYLHLRTIGCADSGVLARVSAAAHLAGLTRGEHYNLVRLQLDGSTVALLQYSAFFDDPFPALAASWLVPHAGTVS